jgi:hypothetical protein
VDQRTLRLRDGQRLADRHVLAAADSWLPVIAFSSAAFLTAKQRHRQPDDQQVDVRHLHHRQRPAQQRHVLRRLGVLVVQLLRAEGIRGEPTSGPTS